ncbi:MAG: hypothetical protein K2O04_07880 [Clostridiales bacterium]|nr:hypothetical protein [Clostridiales bacterium]
MSTFKIILKAALPFVIIGLIGVVLGAVLLLVGVLSDVFGLIVAGGLIAIVGIALFFCAYSKARFVKLSICTQCNKFFGDTDKSIEYSFKCNQYEAQYDKQSGNIKGYNFHYTCTVVCPHCGSTVTFSQTQFAKDEAKANAKLDSWLKSLLKMKNS